MIWVIAGTLDGRRLAVSIQERTGKPVFVSVVSAYGAKLAEHEGIEVYTGRLDKDAMVHIIREKNIDLIVDASHPYAEVVTNTAIEAARESKIDYIRFERQEVHLPSYDKLYHTTNEKEAAQLAGTLASSLSKKVYLTTGSKTLPIFAQSESLKGIEVWTRVLPTATVIKECEELGFTPKYIVAMQGPFSYNMNKTMFEDTAADVVVMKNSGLVGGSDTKLQAAIDLGLHIIVIDRPSRPSHICVVSSVDDIFQKWEEK